MKSLNATRVLLVLLTFALCATPELMAQSQNPQPLDHQSNIPQALQSQPATPIDAATPQTSESPLPDAPSGQQSTAAAPAQDQVPTPAPERLTSTPTQQPLGTAAAQKGVTSGGAASRPAGSAIAPVKQRQVRSWIIKLGAVAAAGVALGAVYGLSKSSPSTPPGAAK